MQVVRRCLALASSTAAKLSFTAHKLPTSARSPAAQPAMSDAPAAADRVETRIVRVDPERIDDALLAEPVELLKSGEVCLAGVAVHRASADNRSCSRARQVVVIPTETVYGLGANALSADACAKIFRAKNRPSDNPLIVHIADRAMLAQLTDAAACARIACLDAILDRFWPGPLTVLLPKSALVPDLVTAGHASVAVRMPSHAVARRLIELAGVPIAAPSANLSGRPSPTTAMHSFVDLAGRVRCIVDGGPCGVGVESTVVDLLCEPPAILRPGGVTLEQLRELVPTMSVFRALHVDKPATPGLKYKHYSPNAPVVLFEGPVALMAEAVLQRLRAQALEGGLVVGLIHTQPGITLPDELLACERLRVLPLGNGADLDVVARGIFGALRELDEAGCAEIVIEGVSEAHEGLAVMNRVRKAASAVHVLS